MAAAADTPVTQPAATVEQRVLGQLQGGSGEQWFEVMDMASGKVYFWNRATNEVAWDPPAGSTPRSRQTTDAVFAAAHEKAATSPLAQPAGDTPISQGAPDSAAEEGEARLDQHAPEGVLKPDDPPNVTPQQLQGLAQLLHEEAASRHGLPAPLQRLSIRAEAVRDFQSAFAAMAAAAGDSLVVPKAAWQAWLHRQYADISSEAAGSTAESAVQVQQPGGRPALGPPQSMPSPSHLPEEGELPPDAAEVSQDDDADMDIDMDSENLPLHQPAAQTQAGSEENAPPLPDDEVIAGPDSAPPLPVDESSSGTSGPGCTAVEYLSAALRPPAAAAEPAVVKRKEYAAQPVRSYTPPQVDYSLAFDDSAAAEPSHAAAYAAAYAAPQVAGLVLGCHLQVDATAAASTWQ